MKKISFLAIFFFIPSISFALECDIVGSGFTSPYEGWNTTWTDTGTLKRGLPTFTNGTYYLAINPVAYDPDLLYWIIDTTNESSGGFPAFRSYSGATSYLGVYKRNVEGLPDDGTFTEDCGEAPPEEEVYTTESLLATLIFGIVIIIVLLFLVLISYMYNLSGTRKTWKK